MESQVIALFGEAEKGIYRKAYLCKTLPQLVDNLGQPPPDSKGLYYAVQAILYDHQLLFFRVREEGFSYDDYLEGIELLRSSHLDIDLSAIFAPGVGSSKIIEAMTYACQLYRSILITTETDLYDYLTAHER